MKRLLYGAALIVSVMTAGVSTLCPAAANASPNAAHRVMVTASNPFITNCDGLQEEFEIGPGNHLYHAWQVPGGGWTGWNSLGGELIYGEIAVVVNVTCKVEVFGVGTDHAVWHIWQTNPGSGPWSNWASLGGYVIGPPAAWLQGDRYAEISAYGANGAAWCDEQENPGGGPWTGWWPCDTVRV